VPRLPENDLTGKRKYCRIHSIESSRIVTANIILTANTRIKMVWFAGRSVFRISHSKEKVESYPVVLKFGFSSAIEISIISEKMNPLKGKIMNTFVNAVVNQEARTTNGMMARKGTANAVVDLFYKIGGSRGKDITKDFVAALVENEDLALRVALWARDARGGAGERQLFRDILKYLEKNRPDLAERVLAKVPELGRWDDVFVFETKELKSKAYTMLGDALRAKNGLAAKWTPRKGQIAREIREFFGMSPKFYRKSLVELTNVVEQKMCAKDWNDINFSHVPSVASARYKKAFYRNATEAYSAYVASLVKGDNPKVKVNAGAVFPYDVLKGVIGSYNMNYNKTELDLLTKQWESLENFVGDANVLPLVDVSGSMTCPTGGYGSKSKTTCLDVAVSLGLYLADKNKGKFKDTFLTFSGSPELLHLKGNIVQKVQQMVSSTWGMNTDLVKAMDKILKTAVQGGVPQEEMPEILLILSDMQFDQCARFDDSAMKMIQRKFTDAGYEVPKLVFWNLNAHDNVPVKYDTRGVALVSGFSPTLMTAVLGGDTEKFTPEAIMLKAIMVDRYNV